MNGVECVECGKGFTDEEWNQRHSAANGADVHAECCVQCKKGERNIPDDMRAWAKRVKSEEGK